VVSRNNLRFWSHRGAVQEFSRGLGAKRATPEKESRKSSHPAGVRRTCGLRLPGVSLAALAQPPAKLLHRSAVRYPLGVLAL
jgi:hypothetical protein